MDGKWKSDNFILYTSTDLTTLTAILVLLLLPLIVYNDLLSLRTLQSDKKIRHCSAMIDIK
jgi:hypothetical protein